MDDGLHRTPDWARLSRAGIFQVADRPGEIVLERKRDASRTLVTWWLALVALISLPALLLGGLGALLLVTVICTLPSGLMILMIRRGFEQYADRVVFRPEGVYGFRGRRQKRYLPRDAMQQIATDEVRGGVRYHRFVADVGYFSAFPQADPTDQVLMNNVLMAAFNQPLHLDVPEPAAWAAAAPAMPQLKLSALGA